jgi:hypothetical protein
MNISLKIFRDYKVGNCIGFLGEKHYNLCLSLEKKTKSHQLENNYITKKNNTK